MSEKIVVPRFATEPEEADWWFENREEHGRIMAKAMDEGRTFTMKQLLAERGLGGPRVSVPIDFDDMMHAREPANAKGVDAEVYVRELLHEALARTMPLSRASVCFITRERHPKVHPDAGKL